MGKSSRALSWQTFFQAKVRGFPICGLLSMNSLKSKGNLELFVRKIHVYLSIYGTLGLIVSIADITILTAIKTPKRFVGKKP